VLPLVGELMGLLDRDEFCQRLLTALPETALADWCALNELPAELPNTISLTHPAVPDEMHESSPATPHRTRSPRTSWPPAGRATSFSDLITRRQLHRLDL
jgi:hypothetical protein